MAGECSMKTPTIGRLPPSSCGRANARNLHDHASWGCAVTVQGIERDRRFVPGSTGEPVLSYERDYPAGTGYVFDPTDVHQPVGADPGQVTVALHFLVHDHAHNSAVPEIVEWPQQYIEVAA